MFLKKKQIQAMSWRTIHQSVFRRSATWAGTKRKFGKIIKLGLAFLLFLFACLSITWGYFYYKHPRQLSSTLSFIQGLPIENIEFKTNGVIYLDIIKKQLKLDLYPSLLALDIHQMKQSLEQVNQIKSASLVKVFPNTLKIEIIEHVPMARVATRDSREKLQVLFVSEEGILYLPHCYKDTFVNQLPWLDGVKLIKNQFGFEPLLNVKPLAGLLARAKQVKPHLYTQFQVVRCQFLDKDAKVPWSTVTIKTKNWGEIIFSSSNYIEELERLDCILAELKSKNISTVKKIDLSLTNQAIVVE